MKSGLARRGVFGQCHPIKTFQLLPLHSLFPVLLHSLASDHRSRAKLSIDCTQNKLKSSSKFYLFLSRYIPRFAASFLLLSRLHFAPAILASNILKEPWLPIRQPSPMVTRRTSTRSV